MSYYKVVNDKKGKGHGFGKPYNKDKYKKKDVGGGSKVNVAEVKCYKCGIYGHFANDCKKGDSCYKCGQKGHVVADCKRNDIVCFNCNEEGHIGSQCKQPKRAPTTGRVFALTGTQTDSDDRLIRGTCYINNTPLVAIIDTGEIGRAHV